MLYFEIKTHRPGITYEKPHFFILNKGQNSGRPMCIPCPNCFVVITKNEADKTTLFYLTMILQQGQYFAYYLKGSVIPFITINDCKRTMLSLSNHNPEDLKKRIKAIQLIAQNEEALKQNLNKLKQLKQAFINASLKCNIK
ncbi:DUF6943 family protein [Aestuariibaculum marinum]|uniref:Type I restriction modification DNA specificity domain-containing protein n=1 Tax=Aestuariibaculum marinum TaxID=2683592 RepID=A0A8J6U4W4_9FLAO|nr:hypothetical protein [Aestuariibaculum marinum]MBD0824455.1 hypothetical protein [Aestuariibaculum marinum]